MCIARRFVVLFKKREKKKGKFRRKIRCVAIVKREKKPKVYEQKKMEPFFCFFFVLRCGEVLAP